MEQGKGMSYRNPVICQKARELALDIHKMRLNRLPQFELYEEGSGEENKQFYSIGRKRAWNGSMRVPCMLGEKFFIQHRVSSPVK
jgi:hypothetical protein